jgi:hypothetical protein
MNNETEGEGRQYTGRAALPLSVIHQPGEDSGVW